MLHIHINLNTIGIKIKCMTGITIFNYIGTYTFRSSTCGTGLQKEKKTI